MPPDGPEKFRRTWSGPILLWVALVTLAGTLMLGVGVLVHRHPTLVSDIWPGPDTAPRTVP